MLSNILDRVSFWVLFAVIVLLPIFFLPFTHIPIETSKGLLLVLGLAISIIFWIAARLLDGKIIIPKSLFLFSGFGVLLSFLISAFFSSSQNTSFFGIMFDIGTFYFMLGAFLLMFFSSVLLREKKNARTVFWGIIISSTVLFLFQALRLFMPDLLSLGVLSSQTSNIFGSWNAFGIFTGFSVIASLFVIEFFSVSKITKYLLEILIIFSMILSATVNFSLVWQLLGAFALIIFVYKISFSFSKKQTENNEKKYFPVFSFVVVMISLLFFISGQFIGGILPNYFKLSNIEVGPSFATTMSVTKDALMKDPILGIGPNKFAEVWAMYKPDVINYTQFWDTSFNFGSGLLPTFASTTGILGIITWLIFFTLFIITGLKYLFFSIKNNVNWEMVVFFVISLYLFIASFFYSTGEVIFLLAFAFTGIFIGLSSNSVSDGEIIISLQDSPKKSFFSVLLLVVLMILTAATGFKYVERLASVSYFGKAYTASTISEADNFVSKAVSLYKNDLYLRTYAQVYLAKINLIISKEELSETDKTDLQANINNAISNAQMAVDYDKSNYLNYNSLGTVYNTVALLGVEGANEKAIESYTSASALNPLNPGIKLSLSRVYLSQGDTKNARAFVEESLSLKSDYLEALIVASQVEKKDGNNTKAISYAEKALVLAPDNKDLIRYVNSLKNQSFSDTTSDTKEKESNKKTKQ